MSAVRLDRGTKRAGRALYALILASALAGPSAVAHVVQPETFHPAIESYRRATFLLNLNPVLWDQVRNDTERIAAELESISPARAADYRKSVAQAIAAIAPAGPDGEGPGPEARRSAAREVFELSTRAVADLLRHELAALRASGDDRRAATQRLDLSRQYWAGFEYEVRCTDPTAFREIGLCWLKIATALGSDALLGQGEVPVDVATVQRECDEIIAYVTQCFGGFRAGQRNGLAPVPHASPTYDAQAAIPPKLPPGSNINKQRPRPRQILNLVARGVDETETPLVAFGDMAFDSPLIFGEPARSLGLSCNNCHNKSITNPQFVIPGLSRYPGGLDVSSSFFAPHANNGHFDPLDIPDLRGIRFTAPYGRNGRFASLRDFIRNVIVNEFNGPEPDPIVVDAMLAYILEFDFLPNPKLRPDGSLSQVASDAARRGEKLFHQPFAQMEGRSCASCHVPTSHFVDGRRHDIGSVAGAEDHSLDRALDTPTLLSSRFTAPYFHDGSLATLKDVVQWFNERYALRLSSQEIADLTEYLEAVGDGVEPYEERADIASPGEVEEQYIFMSAWEFVRDKNKPELADLLFRTVAQELRNEKWGLRYTEATEVVERMARLADECVAANAARQTAAVDAKVAEFRRLYEANKPLIDGDAAPGEPPDQPIAAQPEPPPAALQARLPAREQQSLVDYLRSRP